jgi:hypothetical protein
LKNNLLQSFYQDKNKSESEMINKYDSLGGIPEYEPLKF